MSPRERRGDEAGLALVVLPHARVERALRGIGKDVDDIVLIALTLDPALALRDLRRQPRHIEVVERLQPELRVDAGPHRVGGTDQEAHLAGAHVAEQALLGLGLLEVLHEGDLGRRHAHADKLVSDPAIGREAARLLDADRSEVGEDHLRGARQLVGLAVGAHVAVSRRLLPDAQGIGDEQVQLVVRLVVVVRIDQTQVDRRMAAVGDDGEQDVVARLRRPVAHLDRLDPRVEHGAGSA